MTLDEKQQEEQKIVESDKLLAGRYELMECIGEGGFGAVYRARQLSTGQQVAVKFLTLDRLSQKDVARFEQEVAVLSKLSHPNIVTIIDSGTSDEGKPFLVLHFVEGQTLSKWMEKHSQLQWDEFKDIFVQVCNGLSHAHSKGVIHRDVKPSNIMIIEESDGQRIAKLVDFGIARDYESSVRATTTGAVIGSPAYISPEQAGGYPVDARTDIYSLGCVMYECLTGRLPFEAETALQSVVKRLNEDPIPFEANGLESIVMHAMQREPAKRFETANALANELNKFSPRTGEITARTLLSKRRKPDAMPTGGYILVATASALVFGLITYFILHNTPTAITSVGPVHPIAFDHDREASVIFRNKHRWYDAIDCDEHALKLDPKSTTPLEWGLAQLDLGHLYREVGQQDKAEKMMNAARDTFHKIGDRFWEGNASAHLSEVYAQSNRLPDARKTADEALQQMTENYTRTSWQSFWWMPGSFYCCADTYERSGDNKKALEIYQKGLDYMDGKGMGNDQALPWYLDQYAAFLLRIGDKSKAAQIGARAAAIRQTLGRG